MKLVFITLGQTCSVLGLIIFVAQGCKSPDKNRFNAKDELVVITENIPSNISPLYATDASQQNLNNLIHGALVQIGKDQTPQPDLAESWKIQNAQKFTIKLKPALLFQDGTSLTSADVKRSIEFFQNPDFVSPHTAVFLHIKEVRVLDSLNIEFKTDSPQPFLMTDLVLLKIFKFNENQIVAAGRFKMIQHEVGMIKLERNFEFYEKQKPNAYRFLIFKGVREDVTRYQLLQRGDVQAELNSLSLTITEKLKESLPAHLKLIESPGINVGYLAFNFNIPILKNIKVRQAIAHAINIDEILKYRIFGLGYRSVGLLSPFHQDFEKNVKTFEYDPERSKKLLDEAGYVIRLKEKTRFSIEIKTTFDKNGLDRTRIIAEYLRAVGIDVKIRTVEMGVFFADLKTGNFQLFSSRWIGISDPSIYYRTFHSSQFNSLNRGHYSNPELDRWIEKGISEPDDLKRKTAFIKVQKITAEKLPYVFLWHWNNVFIVNKEVEGIDLYPNGNYLMFNKLTREGYEK